MSQVKYMNGTKLLIQIGNGATPSEVFAHDCLINTDRGIAFSADENRQVIPDCDNPDDPAWSVLNKDGLQAQITGSGMLHTTSLEAWFDWFNSDDAKNIRVVIDVPAGAGGGYWEMAAKLTGFEVSGSRNEKATISVTIGSDGPVAWVDAA